MNLNWPTVATLAAVGVSWVGIWYLRKRELNFSLVALFALIVGIPIGLVAQEHVESINPIGRIYINVLLATVGPLILIAIVSAITSLGSLAKLRSIGLRSAGWLLLSNALGVILALGLCFVFMPGKGVGNQLGSVSSDTISGQVQEFSQVVVGFFPTNVVGAFGANAVIPIILIAITLSVAYLSVAEKDGAKVKVFADGVEALKLVIFKVVSYVIKLTPYAIVALTAHMVGTSANLGDSFWSLVGLLALVWAACVIHTYAINAVILRTFANVPVIAFFKKIFPAQLTAFTTQSSAGTLPVTTRQLTRKVGVHSEIAHFTAPLGSTIGMPGCAGIWPIMVALWGINAYGLAYSPADYALLTFLSIVVSVGVAGVPGAATVSAATVLSAAGLPLEFVAATIPISMIADMARTATNVSAAAVSATVVARQTGLLNDAIFEGREEYVEAEEHAPATATTAPAAAPVSSGQPAPPHQAPAAAPARQPVPAQSAPVYQGASAQPTAPVYQPAPAGQPAPAYAAAPAYQTAPGQPAYAGQPTYASAPVYQGQPAQPAYAPQPTYQGQPTYAGQPGHQGQPVAPGYAPGYQGHPAQPGYASAPTYQGQPGYPTQAHPAYPQTGYPAQAGAPIYQVPAGYVPAPRQVAPLQPVVAAHTLTPPVNGNGHAAGPDQTLVRS